ncbi:glycosyltransferase family 4 protein [Planctomicrobium sp. SH664]|uniref:glycosyltransferase family 4 protein n=1 Tax=Planctomicrobium sp. SH664 TaxID=3448125 RepID=UPI003F5BFDF5
MQREPTDPLDALLILGTYQLRGSFSRALSLASRLPPERVKIRLLSTDPVQVTTQRGQQLNSLAYRSLLWPGLGRLTRRWAWSDLRRDPPDLIDIQHRRMLPLGNWLARKLQRPYLVTVHDYLRERERFIVDLQWCRRIIAVSESVRSELLDRTRLPEELVTVIASGVQPPEESQLLPILSAGRSPVIGTAGPLEAGKGLRHFLRAAAIILKQQPNAMFVVAGSGPEESSLRRLAMELQISQSLTILPNLHDFSPALRAMDIFVLPALKQGLGTTMLQAMSCGLPVIGTESGGVFSVVTDGVTGLLIPPSDEEKLAERVLHLLTHPDEARQLGSNARQRVMEHFHVDQMINATVELYEHITENVTPSSSTRTT